VACAPTHPRRHLLEVLANSALRLLTALPRFLLATLLAALSWLLARLLLSAAALLAALSWLLARLLLSAAALLAALILLAWLLFIRVHNCSFVSSLPTTKPRPLSFLRTLVRKRTIRPVASGGSSIWDRSIRLDGLVRRRHRVTARPPPRRFAPTLPTRGRVNTECVARLIAPEITPRRAADSRCGDRSLSASPCGRA
jgi:hypothetical protein